MDIFSLNLKAIDWGRVYLQSRQGPHHLERQQCKLLCCDLLDATPGPKKFDWVKVHKGVRIYSPQSVVPDPRVAKSYPIQQLPETCQDNGNWKILIQQ